MISESLALIFFAIPFLMLFFCSKELDQDTGKTKYNADDLYVGSADRKKSWKNFCGGQCSLKSCNTDDSRTHIFHCDHSDNDGNGQGDHL